MIRWDGSAFTLDNFRNQSCRFQHAALRIGERIGNIIAAIASCTRCFPERAPVGVGKRNKLNAGHHGSDSPFGTMISHQRKRSVSLAMEPAAGCPDTGSASGGLY